MRHTMVLSSLSKVACALAFAACTGAAVALSRDGVDVTFSSDGGLQVPQIATRQAVSDGLWPSVDGTYKSVYKFNNNPNCPNTIVMKNNFALNKENTISRVGINDIVEDGNVCTGGNFFSISIAFYLTQEGAAYAKQNHGNVSRRMTLNAAAQGTLSQFVGSRLGLDDYGNSTVKFRTCGTRKYGEDTFWFSIQGGQGNKVSIGPSGAKADTVVFPAGTKGIFLMASEGRYCILRTDADQTQLTTQPPPSTAAPQTIVATVPKPTIVGTTAAGASATTSFVGQNSGTLSVSTTTDPRPGMTVVAGSSDRNGSGNASCFPGDATTQLADGRVVRMDALEVGDNVRVAGGAYSTVFGFTHRDADVRAEFIHMATERGERVQATAGHYLRVNGMLVAAGAVRIGDALENADGLRTRVTHIRKAFGLGLYNPQTLDGEIVVDGILASTYTTAVEPAMAHAWLTPVRAAYRVFGVHCTVFDDGAESLARLLPKGHGIVA